MPANGQTRTPVSTGSSARGHAGLGPGARAATGTVGGPGGGTAVGTAVGAARPGPDVFAAAPCRSADPELFFPAGESPAAAAQVATAKRLCAGCPLRDACLREALRVGATEGIWGGLTAAERRFLHLLAKVPPTARQELVERLEAGRPTVVPKQDRPAAVVSLRQRGWSEVRIADVLGVSAHTVARIDRSAQLAGAALGVVVAAAPPAVRSARPTAAEPAGNAMTPAVWATWAA
ncbi:hypothetical protein GCM10009760_63320 [Kitasatospora kazusensis]|uniref:Transcriptional regulator WhiB n=1 Tax=Kitasatospora kazusensis TaxID=407974 RepID=A0ABN1ZLY0_9ACTN